MIKNNSKETFEKNIAKYKNNMKEYHDNLNKTKEVNKSHLQNNLEVKETKLEKELNKFSDKLDGKLNNFEEKLNDFSSSYDKKIDNVTKSCDIKLESFSKSCDKTIKKIKDLLSNIKINFKKCISNTIIFCKNDYVKIKNIIKNIKAFCSKGNGIVGIILVYLLICIFITIMYLINK